MKVGFQVSVPEALPGSGVNTAFPPAGKLERSAVSDVIAFPSGSEAVTRSVMVAFSATMAAAGADTIGARSTAIEVVAVAVRAFPVAKLTR